MPTFDDRDQAILDERMALLDAIEGPRVGDFVQMLDGSLQRFAHDWGQDHGLQTCDGGSFYLGAGYLSMSGSLNPTVKREALVDTGKHLLGSAWFFHHDWHTAHNGVTVQVPLRVFKEV